VAPDPLPFNFVPGSGLLKLLPKVLILDQLAFDREKSASLPPSQPALDNFPKVFGIGEELHNAGAF
jgi:hypothetical protein